MIKYLILPIFLSTITVSPVLAQSTAVVFAPPSNVRNAPDGEIVCTVTKKVSLNVYEREGEWYYTDLCGGGYIHRSQIRFHSAATGADNVTDRARVVGITKGQLALRDAPNGRSLAGLNNGNVVQILGQQDNWAYVQVIDGLNVQINGMRGWVNSHYLALF